MLLASLPGRVGSEQPEVQKVWMLGRLTECAGLPIISERQAQLSVGQGGAWRLPGSLSLWVCCVPSCCGEMGDDLPGGL